MLVGNPNVGKSVVFNQLTGRYVTVSNYPGTTVDVSRGVAWLGGGKYEVLDSPGTNSLFPRSEDERVTRNVLLERLPDVVIQVADAKNLRRALVITLELAELGIPMVLCLNMADEAEARGIRIDPKRLSQILGIPVVFTVAVDGEGIPDLKRAVGHASVCPYRCAYSREVEWALKVLEEKVPSGIRGARGIAALAMAGDPGVDPGRIGGNGVPSLTPLLEAASESRRRFLRPPAIMLLEGQQARVEEIYGECCVVIPQRHSSWLAKLGQWAMRPFPGYLLALGVLYVLYEFVGVFAAGTAVDFLERTVFGKFINPSASKIVSAVVPWAWLRDMIVGPYGMITMGMTYAFALILPIVSAFFFFFGFLEDSGYLPRLSVMLDRLFRLMGLNGKAVLPMILGLGCDTMATLTTRVLDTKKEQLIVIFLLTLAIPCSAQLGVVLGLLGGISWRALMIWVGVLSGTILSVGWLSSRVLPGARSTFVVEIPPMRIPRFNNLFRKVKARLRWYLHEAVPMFILGTWILFVASKIGLLAWLERVGSPIVVRLLGLPSQATEAFIIGFLRRDYGAAGFYKLAKDGLLNPQQVVVSVVAITLFVPCIAQFMVTIKERGLRTSLAITGIVTAFAFLVAGALNWVLSHVRLL